MIQHVQGANILILATSLAKLAQSELMKGPVHKLEENCPRSYQHIGNWGYYLSPQMHKVV